MMMIRLHRLSEFIIFFDSHSHSRQCMRLQCLADISFVVVAQLFVLARILFRAPMAKVLSFHFAAV